LLVKIQAKPPLLSYLVCDTCLDDGSPSPQADVMTNIVRMLPACTQYVSKTALELSSILCGVHFQSASVIHSMVLCWCRHIQCKRDQSAHR